MVFPMLAFEEITVNSIFFRLLEVDFFFNLLFEREILLTLNNTIYI